MRSAVIVAGWLAAVVAPAGPAEAFREQVEADWVLQEQVRRVGDAAVITPQSDAAGACDGVKHGYLGFHTNLEESPWWQVDLGGPAAIGRVVVWNRCDGAAPRSRRLSLLLSDDGEAWRSVYTHDGTTFYGAKRGEPLTVALEGAAARFIRIQLPGRQYLHLDEVEVFGAADPDSNLALDRPADQSSTSRWSTDNRPELPVDWPERATEILARCGDLAADLGELGVDTSRFGIEDVTAETEGLPAKDAYLAARWLQRRLTLAHPLLDFEGVFFAKRVPGSYNHMSDQYYGWWSRPGGGLCVLRDFRSDAPEVECLSDSIEGPGSFLRPILSFDGRRALYAWCRHYPGLAAEKDKLDKANVPEDAFYHVFEMDLRSREVRQLTHGKYDDFDARYLPDGRIVFLSTRRGQFVQVGRATAARTASHEALPDVYVRCGGGPERPVAVYTLHTMDGDGGDLCAISPFEMFEWTPSVAQDGTILHARWDYIDRHNMPYMSLWALNPDGTHPTIVYGNFTHAPHCIFEARCVPDSNKIVFTASAHHAQTMGSLVLLDPAVGSEGDAPITRLTPEVAFPEIEAWPQSYFANPWPLSERFHLVAWGCVDATREGQRMAPNAMGLYLFDADGNLELLHRDPAISSAWPMPLRPRPRPHQRPDGVDWDAPQEGRFLLADVYHGLGETRRGDVKALRIVSVPAKTHPTMNYPTMGLTRDDPGKCVLGTVPVEADGSAHFRAPTGVIVFFQALDAEGMAIQTMRSTTHVQPGQTLSCAGCHESRHETPHLKPALAATREPSKVAVGPDGSWPLRFDQLVQPVLDRHCVGCHGPDGDEPEAAKLDLTSAKAYESLCHYGKPSLADHVLARYSGGRSVAGACAARSSALLAKLNSPEGHHEVELDGDARERLITWVDTYGQRLGSFSDDQEHRLREMRERNRDMLIERAATRVAAGPAHAEAPVLVTVAEGQGSVP